MTAANMMEFAEFAGRFVRRYWEEIARGVPEFRDHSEPCEQTLEELLGEIKYQVTYGDGDALSVNSTYHLRMQNSTGDVWHFTFERARGQWTLVSATSGSKLNEDHVDLLDEVYCRWFSPFLNRILNDAMRPD